MLAFASRHPFLIGISLLLLALSFYLAWRKHAMLRTGHLSRGEVVGLISIPGKSSPTYKLHVSYIDPSGEPAQFTTSFATNPPLHNQGEKVTVVTYPNKLTPDIFGFTDLFLFPWILFCISGAILLFCAGFAYGPAILNYLYVPESVSLRSMGLLK